MDHQIVVVGGGSAGIAVAATLLRKNKTLDVAIIEPSDTHYYQPAFTLVGGGSYNIDDTKRAESRCVPSGANWIKDAVDSFDPDNNTLTTANGNTIGYDYLIVCPGIQLDWNKVEGLEDTIGKNEVCSNYLPQYATYTWECIRKFKGGKAIFTQPPMPIKCAGAPQKIMYMAANHFQRNHLSADINFNTSIGAMFGVPLFAAALEKTVQRYGIDVDYKSTLVAIDGNEKQAVFEVEDKDGNKNRVTKPYDMIHVTPPQSAPDFIKGSPLANAGGWVEVDPATLQHTRFDNVFGLGDGASTPNAKTAAAARLQAPIVVKNLLAKINNQTLPQKYDGYGACPLVTSHNTVMLAEFCYDGKVTPTFPLDPRKERYAYWLMKKHLFPFLYWNIMLKGIEWNVPHKEFTA